MVRLTNFALLLPNLFMLRNLQRIGNNSSTCLSLNMRTAFIGSPTYFGAEASIEKMQSKTETRQTFVYVFAEIQNPKQIRKI